MDYDPLAVYLFMPIRANKYYHGGSFFSRIGHAFRHLGHDIAHTAKSVGHDIEKGATVAVKDVRKVGKTAVKDVGKASRVTFAEAKKVGKVVGKDVAKVGKTAYDYEKKHYRAQLAKALPYAEKFVINPLIESGTTALGSLVGNPELGEAAYLGLTYGEKALNPYLQKKIRGNQKLI
jgi:hypothetical protein